MAELVTSGRIVDFILGFMALELIGLALFRYFTGRGLPPLEIVANLAAGAFLLLAVRSSSQGSGWGLTATFLSLSLPPHLIDLYLRWRTCSRRP